MHQGIGWTKILSTGYNLIWKRFSLSYEHHLSCSENNVRKREQIQTYTEFEPMISAIPVQRSTYWAIEPTGSHFTGLFGTNWNTGSWLVSSVGRAVHRYRRGHRFKSCTCLNLFQALFSLLLKLCSQLRGSLLYSFLRLRFTYMIFIYLQSFIHHFMGLFGTNLITSALPTELTSQLGTISKVSQVYLEPSWTLAVGLLAQLVERCTGIARVMGSNPLRQTAKIASIFVSSTAVHIYDFTVVL